MLIHHVIDVYFLLETKRQPAQKNLSTFFGMNRILDGLLYMLLGNPVVF
jgi:hypothetical protein